MIQIFYIDSIRYTSVAYGKQALKKVVRSTPEKVKVEEG
jgi:hypothetical protein